MKLRTFALAAAAVAASTAFSAQAAATSYNVTETFYEPDTQPNNSIFIGTFDYDASTHVVSNLKGKLSESMTGSSTGYPNDTMTWLDLSYQLVSWYDASLGGTFAAAFKNTTTNTFWTGDGGDGWSPDSGVAAGGTYYGFPKVAKNPGNAYALIFVPDSPLTALTQSQIDKLAYADCAPGGMMGAVCMTGTSVAGYGSVGTMSGVPVSEVITASVPEPNSAVLTLAGLAVAAGVWRRRSRSSI
ncbi:PEP-CTERM sorting domain-containing protein [Aquabacterium sp.]|uniref:PEP-CTERM sorting domain-containing protein n=1 Tax=Aquabacterium sp. TaxID=1872578 RepID=UPI0035AEEFC1